MSQQDSASVASNSISTGSEVPLTTATNTTATEPVTATCKAPRPKIIKNAKTPPPLSREALLRQEVTVLRARMKTLDGRLLQELAFRQELDERINKHARDSDVGESLCRCAGSEAERLVHAHALASIQAERVAWAQKEAAYQEQINAATLLRETQEAQHQVVIKKHSALEKGLKVAVDNNARLEAQTMKMLEDMKVIYAALGNLQVNPVNAESSMGSTSGTVEAAPGSVGVHVHTEGTISTSTLTEGSSNSGGGIVPAISGAGVVTTSHSLLQHADLSPG
jgi:hypothetical protein